MTLSFVHRTLPNGLDVIVHEDHRVPLAAVSVWYHVGSKNERPGRTGLAHLFEHLMFEGSVHSPGSYFVPLQAAGATLNGSTNADRTDYWEVVPTEALRLALWMEADRMGWLLPALTPERFETQRAVVLNERRQQYENRPYGLAQFALARALFPDGHPYSWPTIGEPDDLVAASLDDAREFFTRYYHPANASLVVAGDVEAGEVFDDVEALFGDIPAGPPVEPVAAALVTARPAEVTLEDRVELSRLYLAWPSPPLFAAGDAELDLAADALAHGRTARLYRRLIHDERIAADVAAMQVSRELSSMFQIVITAASGRSIDDVRAVALDELARFGGEGPDEDEMVRARARTEAAFAARLQALGGFGGRADQLNAYHVYRGEPDWFDADLGRYLTATPASVREAVRDWLDPATAVELVVVPRAR